MALWGELFLGHPPLPLDLPRSLALGLQGELLPAAPSLPQDLLRCLALGQWEVLGVPSLPQDHLTQSTQQEAVLQGLQWRQCKAGLLRVQKWRWSSGQGQAHRQGQHWRRSP